MANWQLAMKKNKAVLVLRGPGSKTFHTLIKPQLKLKIAPFRRTVKTSIEQLNRVPHFLYYLDFYLAMFTDEFDCSPNVINSKIESQMLVNKVPKIQPKLNEFLVNWCRKGNRYMISRLRMPVIHNTMEGMREFVVEMASDEGRNEFKSVWGEVFNNKLEDF